MHGALTRLFSGPVVALDPLAPCIITLKFVNQGFVNQGFGQKRPEKRQYATRKRRWPRQESRDGTSGRQETERRVCRVHRRKLGAAGSKIDEKTTFLHWKKPDAGTKFFMPESGKSCRISLAIELIFHIFGVLGFWGNQCQFLLIMQN